MVNGKQTLEETPVCEQIEWLLASIRNSNGLSEEFTSTERIKNLITELEFELLIRGEFKP